MIIIMNFVLEVLDKFCYLLEIDKLFKIKECVIFFDINIFVFYLSFYMKVRKEFVKWLCDMVKDGRVKIFSWILYEYMNYVIIGKIKNYLNLIK